MTKARDLSKLADGTEFTAADNSKLDGIEASATADQTSAQIKAAVEAASDSNVFTDADHSKLNGVAASANNYVHPNHSGEVTSTADGATVIADNIVDEANLKISNSPTNGTFLSAQSGNAGGLTWAAVPAGYADSDVAAFLAGGVTRFLTTATKIETAIFRVNDQTLNTNTTIDADENANATGPLTVASGVTLTVNGNLTVV